MLKKTKIGFLESGASAIFKGTTGTNGCGIIQGRNQDLNLAKLKYEILTGHKNRCL